jgi:hypothetical protein
MADFDRGRNMFNSTKVYEALFVGGATDFPHCDN